MTYSQVFIDRLQQLLRLRLLLLWGCKLCVEPCICFQVAFLVETIKSGSRGDPRIVQQCPTGHSIVHGNKNDKGQ
jgi:hypothetical protein